MHSTCDCTSSTYETTRDVEISVNVLSMYLDQDGQISASDCELLCNPEQGETVLGCGVDHADADAGDRRVLHCRVSAVAYCEGRRHAINRGNSTGLGPDAAAAWMARTARAEAASVPAFLALRHELGALGAPGELLDRALSAAADEVSHARLIGALARRRGGRRAPLRRRSALPARSAMSIARENAIEGCVHETFAALMAGRQAAHARDPRVRRAFACILPDETRHAELAWDIHRFLTSKLDSRERRRVRSAMRAAAARLIVSLGKPSVPLGARRALGLPDPPEVVRMARALDALLWSEG